jgi:tetratricopeptide (TPR) repeat protein
VTTNKLPLFVVREGGAYQLRAAGSGSAGCEALTMARAGRKAAAVQWLTWARDMVSPAGGDDPLRDDPFLAFWTDKKDEVELSAASLCASTGHPELTVSTLDGELAKASGERATKLELALVEAYSSGGHDAERLAASRRLAKDVPTSARAWHYEAKAFELLGRLQEQRDEAAARVAQDPTDADRLASLAFAESKLGHFEEARAVGERLIATTKGGAGAYNNQAWRSLYTTVKSRDLEYALKAVNASPSEPNFLNTLAAVEVALGHTADAWDHLFKAIDLRPDKEPNDGDWYVLGRIAERLGLPDEARAAYSKVPPPEKRFGQYTMAHLVQERLRTLK